MQLKDKYDINDLLEIMKILRSDKGCPWDRVQTHQSIKKSLIEECYEAIDALDKNDWKAFSNELGDVLLQVVFHCEIANERDCFNFDDVLYELCTKLITRHTHVFATDNATSSKEALDNWEKNKKKETSAQTYTEMLNDVPHSFPSLLRAQKVQKKAGSAGFDFKNEQEVLDKLYEEIDEFKKAVTEEEIKEEFGDVLFAAVNVGRFKGLDGETALKESVEKFIDRFSRMEQLCLEENTSIDALNAQQLDALWCKIKQKTKKK